MMKINMMADIQRDGVKRLPSIIYAEIAWLHLRAIGAPRETGIPKRGKCLKYSIRKRASHAQ